MTPTTTSRRALLLAALGFAEIRWRYRPDAAGALDKYLRTWRGMGAVIAGMHPQGFDVEVKRLGQTWRATFYRAASRIPWRTGPTKSPAPWRAVTKAAWQAIGDPRMVA